MILKEFFGQAINPLKSENIKNKSDISDDVFWYILDHDKLHKDYYFPISKVIKKSKQRDHDKIIERFMPMVNKGCKEYYNDKKMEGKLGKCFPKEMREELCQRLYDHYYNLYKK